MNNSSSLKCFINIELRDFLSIIPKEIASLRVFFDDKVAYTEEKINFLKKFIMSYEDFPIIFCYSETLTINKVKIELMIEGKKKTFEKKINVSNKETKIFKIYDETFSIQVKIEFNLQEISNDELINSIGSFLKINTEIKKNKIKNKSNKMVKK